VQDQGVDVGFLDGEGEGEVCEGGGQGVDDLFFEGRGAVVGHVVGVLAGGWGVFGLDKQIFSPHKPFLNRLPDPISQPFLIVMFWLGCSVESSEACSDG